MKTCLSVVFILVYHFCFSQVTWDFEEFNLADNSYMNDAGSEAGFSNGLIFLPNYYDKEFFYWTGWAVSNVKDVTTPGFVNQYSAITGSGFNGSKHYVVNSAFGNNNLVLKDQAKGKPLNGLYVTNSTYAWFSMKDGDAFAKKFGGVTGNDPDYFLLTIKAYSEGDLKKDSVNFYLADYRFSDNNQDYIVKTWEWIDLTGLGNVDSLSFTLSSSDNGQFGMNTPAYFCADFMITAGSISNHEVFDNKVSVFPNPAKESVQISLEHFEGTVFIYVSDVSGNILITKEIRSSEEKIILDQLNCGHYFLSIKNGTKNFEVVPFFKY